MSSEATSKRPADPDQTTAYRPLYDIYPPSFLLQMEGRALPAHMVAHMVASSSSPKEKVNGSNGANGFTRANLTPVSHGSPSYENIDHHQITIRQLQEDIDAYHYDLSFCEEQLAAADLTPQEARTMQLRTLDLGHQIRACKHRIENMQIQKRMADRTAIPAYRPGTAAKRPLDARSANGVNGSASAKRPKLVGSPDDDNEDIEETNELRRLGMWNCRLCKSDKYMLAGEGRLPSAPCKWPLKDISKMITHFTDMHNEHDPDERCMELGAALDRNRGPFEYWLRRSRSQKIGDGAIIEECITELQGGRMPDLLRRLARAAADFPSATV